MAKVLVTDTHLTDIADAIRSKNGSSDTYKPSEMADAISNIESGTTPTGTLDITENGSYDVTEYAGVEVNVASSGGDTLEIARSIIDKTITSYSDDELTSIGTYMFYNCSKMTELNTPNVTSIGAYAFQGSKVKTMYFPKLTTAVANVFRNAKSIKNIDLPNCTKLDNASIYACTALKTVNFPKVETLVRACMSGCGAITYIDLPVCTQIGTQAFHNCRALKTLVLRAETICVLDGTDALSTCSALESIYVRDTLLTQYQEYTNWSSFADKIKPLSELEG